MTKYTRNLRDEWDKALKIWKEQDWYQIIIIFKSIKTLTLQADVLLVLDKLPLQLIFDNGNHDHVTFGSN